jgi:hypothetical protein
MRAGRLAGIALLAALALPAHAESLSACFNGGEGKDRISLWVFEGYSDWHEARKGKPGILVLAFSPGSPVYSSGDIAGCFYMPPNTAEKVYRCLSGSMRITKVEPGKTVTGDYRLFLTNGTVKSYEFTAPYCPPWR